MKVNFTSFLLGVCLFLLAMSTGWSQGSTAAINGQVTDVSGAAIANASVTAKDLDRGTAWPVTTNEGGYYDLPRLPIGRYEVRAEAKGFQAAQRSSVVLVLDQVAKLDFQLQVGQVSQTMEVTSQAPLLQTDSTQVSTVMDAHAIANLPLETRNYNQLALLTPGAVTTSPGAFNTGPATFQLRPALYQRQSRASQLLSARWHRQQRIRGQ